jgi:hypothetical protein
MLVRAVARMGKKSGVAVLTLTTQEEWETLLEEEVEVVFWSERSAGAVIQTF